VIFTSGTTGQPKGVVIEHGALLLTAAAVAVRCWSAGPDDVVYCPWSLSHSTGLRALIGALQVGAECVLEQRFEPDRFWQDVAAHRVTCASVLGMSRRLTRALPPGAAGGDTTLRTIFATPSFPDATAVFENLGVTVTEGYGLTETGQCLVNVDARLHPGSIGLPAAYYEVSLQDEEGRIIEAAGVAGEICCRPRHPGLIFPGYFGQLELTVAATRDLWFHTRDLARRDEAGYFTLVGRLGDTLRRSSEMISASVVEAAVGAHPRVQACAILGVEDRERGEELKAVVSWSPPALGEGIDAEQAVEIATWLRGRLPASWIPRYWAFLAIEDMPLTISGKVRKPELRDRLRGVGAIDLHALTARRPT
jgi:acyl-coenzyme A synthetase/AMP-(fatty) acid ligase